MVTIRTLPTCTECGSTMEPLTKYLAGYRDTVLSEQFHFVWGCQHVSAEDAEVRLGSKECVEKFCVNHPEHILAIVALMSKYDTECNHA